MTAKEYLNQISILEARYETKLEEVHDMRLLATSTGAIRYDKENVISSPTDDNMIKAVIKITEAENQAMKVAVELAEKKQLITEQIIGLNDTNAIKILGLYYIKHKKLKEIAEILHFDYDWTRHLHASALELFESTYPKIKDIT